ncbi:MAG TPA: penicillin-binding protein 2 [Steroidobacteraceae bacterium]|nr:penicillin-binding protein 2 [Steroidobacteraceae bacterium]
MISSVRIKDHWAEQRMFLRRTIAAGIIMTLLMGAVLIKLVQLQVVRHDYYFDLSQGNRVRVEPLPPNRGLILDRNGLVLAENLPAYQLELTRELVPDIAATLQILVGLKLVESDDLDRLKRLIRSRPLYESVPIRLQLTDEEVARFAVRRHDIPGVEIRTRLTRHYPYGALAVHALGYVSAISEQDLLHIDASQYAGTTLIGKVGVEASYEQELHGTTGFRQILVNAQGRPVETVNPLQDDLRSKSPISGSDLILSLDLRAQRAAEEALAGRRGAVIAIDPTNGDVIAFVSLPGFDPNTFARGLSRNDYAALETNIDRPLFNRVLRGAYPPGSTIKPVMALAGLDYAAIDPNQVRYCRGFFMLPGSSRRYRDWKPEGHGWVNMQEAVAQSCDTYFYNLAQTLGIDRLSAFLSKFGLGQRTGIDIDGEKPGLVPSREWKLKTFRDAERNWYPGDTVILGIGQGYMLATPLQLAHVASIIAAHGTTFQPRLVTAVRNAHTGQVRRLPTQASPPVDPDETARWQRVVDAMVAVMSSAHGTARATGAGSAYQIAGKTGTAQVFSVGQNEKYNEKEVEERMRDHALFISFAPADAPRIAVAVLVENGGHGASVAAPVARKVMDAYLLPEAPKPEPPKT